MLAVSRFYIGDGNIGFSDGGIAQVGIYACRETMHPSQTLGCELVLEDAGPVLRVVEEESIVAVSRLQCRIRSTALQNVHVKVVYGLQPAEGRFEELGWCIPCAQEEEPALRHRSSRTGNESE